MEKDGNKQFKYGLIGKDISYSFSRGYFAEKFEALGLENHSYENFDLPNIEAFEQLSKSGVKGFNVTIPYKEVILPYLSQIDSMAEEIGAVNTIKVSPDGLIGYNTDAYGFQKSLETYLRERHQNALILGTGGASKAVRYVLDRLGIRWKMVSRNPTAGQLSYTDLDNAVIAEHLLLINCTPLGTHPNTEQKPTLPYAHIGVGHLLFDLIYNPPITAFLKEGEKRGATICNGLQMLQLQAEKAWEIWGEVRREI